MTMVSVTAICSDANRNAAYDKGSAVIFYDDGNITGNF